MAGTTHWTSRSRWCSPSSSATPRRNSSASRSFPGCSRTYRAQAILGLIGASWLALIVFAVVPAIFKVPAMFVNGLCLGMIWGLVFSYMEGRRTSEVLGAVLCASFIVSSGAVKSVGILLIQLAHVPVFWMPAATGLVFVPLLLLSVWGLSLAAAAERRRRGGARSPRADERTARSATFSAITAWASRCW